MKYTRILSAAAATLLVVAVASPGVSQTKKATVKTQAKETPVRTPTPRVEVASNADRLRDNKNETYKAQCIEAIGDALNAQVTYDEQNCKMRLKANNGSNPLSFSFKMESVDVSAGGGPGTKFHVTCRDGSECVSDNRGTTASGMGKRSGRGFQVRNEPSKDLGMCMEWLKDRCKN